MMHERDEWLMSQVALGRHEALEALVRRHANPLLTFIRRMVGDYHRSEELFQDVFVAVWQKRRQYQGPRSFRAWLYAIALNTCRAEFRRRRSAPAVVRDAEAAAAATVDHDAGGGALILTEHATLVLAALDALPPKQRAVVALRTWSGLSYGEIADALGRSEGAVRANMHHALRALRAYLEPRMR